MLEPLMLLSCFMSSSSLKPRAFLSVTDTDSLPPFSVADVSKFFSRAMEGLDSCFLPFNGFFLSLFFCPFRSRLALSSYFSLADKYLVECMLYCEALQPIFVFLVFDKFVSSILSCRSIYLAQSVTQGRNQVN